MTQYLYHVMEFRFFCVISLMVPLPASNHIFPSADSDSRVAISDRSSANPGMLHGILFLE